MVTLVLRSLPSTREESMVFIDLTFGANGEINSAAREVTVGGEMLLRIIETSPAVSLVVDPVAVSRTGRNSGRFSITFEWGSISGTYDTGTAAP